MSEEVYCGERVLCKIEGDGSKRFKGDCVTVTEKRIYKKGINRYGMKHEKTVNIDTVSCVESGDERYVRFLVIGLAFVALCVIWLAYFLPQGATSKKVHIIVLLCVAAAVAVASIIAYIKFKVKIITVYFSGGKLRVAAPGITDAEVREFTVSVLGAAQAARSGEKNG